MTITGTWLLETWRRHETDGTVSYPFGETPQGMLIYTPDGHMAVQMVEAERPRLDTDNPIGGTLQERADAYSSCLAYFGRYELDGTSVIHRLDGSLFENWAGTAQVRPATLDGDQLILHVVDPQTGHVTNEIAWRRPQPGPNAEPCDGSETAP